MKNPETIIRGIMHESVMSAVKKHVGTTDPKKVEKHFKRDEEAAEEIVDLAQSMEEAKGRSNNLYGINHVQTGAHRDIIKLAKTLGYDVGTPGGSSGTMKVRTPEGRLITQITTDGGPGGNRRALVDLHRHQIEIGGFSGTEHTHDSIRDSQRGIREQTETASSSAPAYSEVRKGLVQNLGVTREKPKPLTKKKQIEGMTEEIEQLDEKKSAAWQRKEGKDPEGGLNKKGVESYRRENPGSNLQTAVTTKPSKLKPGSKKAKRRLSFCRRMKGMKRKLTSAKTARDPDSRINKSLRKWNC